MRLERYDLRCGRVAAEIPFSALSPAKTVPGYRYDAAWCGARKDRPACKVWHWPIQSLPMMLRSFADVSTDDPTINLALERSRQINAARVITMDAARTLARDSWDSIAAWKSPTGKSLRAHQLNAVRATLAAGGSRGIFHQTGTGKTITFGRLLSLLVAPKNGMRVGVVVCPVTLIDAAWLPDLSEWFPSLPLLNLRDYAKGLKREQALAAMIREHGHCVALVNYETARTDRSVMRIMSGAYVGFDEVSKCKSYDSSTSIAMREAATTFRGCVVLSGTPAPNGNQEYWPHGKILAPAAGYDPFPGSHSAFAKECLDVETFQRRGDDTRHFAGFSLKEGMAEFIHDRMAPICEWVKKDECLDLPPKVYQRVPVPLSRETAAAYVDMRDRMEVALRAKYDSPEKLRASARNALAQMMKLRQITAGYVPAFPETWLGGNDDSAKVLVPVGREKIDWLLEHCETVNERIVVWTQFIYEAERYAKELAEAKVTRETITGATKENDRHGVFQAFVRGDFQVLIAHPGVAQWGVSFPGVSLASYGSLSYSLQEYAQSQDRIHGIGRGDATKHSTYYLLCARLPGGEETIDDDCVNVLEGKLDALELVFKLNRERREEERRVVA